MMAYPGRKAAVGGREAGRMMLNKDELLILSVAAIDGDGEYCVQRDWNKPWGTDYTYMKNLEVLGLMKIKSAGRIPLTNQWFRRSVITDAGREALAA
jgi:hypothetical protein